jgi:hypothetical protein
MVHSTAKNKKRPARDAKKSLFKGKGRIPAVKEVNFDDDARR